MTDLKTKTMCKAVYLHLSVGMSQEEVADELGLSAAEVKTMLMEYRTRVLGNPKDQTSAKSATRTCAKRKNTR